VRVETDAGRSRLEIFSRPRLVADESWKVGAIAALAIVVGLVAAGARARHNMFWTGDAPFFVAVAHHPFGSTMPGDHLAYGVSYRYGRILFPLSAWLLALGRVAWVNATLLGVYVAAFGAWVALAAEHLRRSGRKPALALGVLALPFSVLAFFRPEVVSEPLAGALLLLVYLFERDGRRRAVLVTAALLVLTREPLVLAMVPLMWTGWKARRFAAARDWLLVMLPYASWVVWLRVRTGQFPFLDPSYSRKEALGGPFEGWLRIWNGASGSQQSGLIFAMLTLLAGGFVARRGHWRYPLTHGVVALCAVIPFLGPSVYRNPIEAFRVVAPIQALLLILLL
jgi:hypothetical protein